MREPTDVASLDRLASARARSLACALLLVAAILATRAPAVRAEIFNVACDPNALASVIATVNGNDEQDLVWLAPSCAYALAATWVVQADSGNPLRVYGRGAILSGQDARTVLVVNAGANLHLSDATIRDGAIAGNGGAILNQGTLTLLRTTVADSAATGYGAGVYNGGTLRATRSTFSGNTGAVEAGGIANNSVGRLTLVDSTVSGNSGSYGGGINNRGRAALFNSTLFGNGAFIGGGILNEPAGRLVLGNVTIARNAISGSYGGGGVRNEGQLRLDNSILADHESVHADCYNSGTITPLTSNLVEDGSCAVLAAFTGDPKLASATGNPQVLPIAADSPAVDAGQNPACAGRDQRGTGRPLDGNADGYAICDLGAFELGGSCGLLGIEGFALLPFAGWLRRRSGRRMPTAATVGWPDPARRAASPGGGCAPDGLRRGRAADAWP